MRVGALFLIWIGLMLFLKCNREREIEEQKIEDYSKRMREWEDSVHREQVMFEEYVEQK